MDKGRASARPTTACTAVASGDRTLQRDPLAPHHATFQPEALRRTESAYRSDSTTQASGSGTAGRKQRRSSSLYCEQFVIST